MKTSVSKLLKSRLVQAAGGLAVIAVAASIAWSDPSEGRVKLVDFGLAKANSQIESTDPGVVKGKFSYLSPEAARALAQAFGELAAGPDLACNHRGSPQNPHLGAVAPAVPYLAAVFLLAQHAHNDGETRMAVQDGPAAAGFEDTPVRHQFA